MKSILHMNNKAKKVIDKILLSTLLFFLTANLALASGDINQAVDNLNNGTGVYATIREIMGVLAWIGFAIAIAKLLQIGMMFMIGSGSGKNNAKTALIPWVVGALVCILFGTVGPWIIGLIMGDGEGGVFDI